MSSIPGVDELAVAVHEIVVSEPVSDAALADEVAELRRLADLAEAAYTARLRMFDARGVSESQEVLTTRQWARLHCQVAPGETGQQLALGRVVEHLPVVRQAWLTGQIRLPHVSVIADAVALFGVETIAQCRDALVKAARVNDPQLMRAALRGYGLAVDSKNARRRARKHEQDCWLDLASTFEGAVAIEGVLDAEAGGIVKQAIDHASRPTGAGDLRLEIPMGAP